MIEPDHLASMSLSKPDLTNYTLNLGSYSLINPSCVHEMEKNRCSVLRAVMRVDRHWLDEDIGNGGVDNEND